MGIIENPKREKSPVTRKGTATIVSFSKTTSSTSSLSFSLSIPRLPSSRRHTFSKSMMEENIENAERMIAKWDLNASSYTKFTYLFQENRKEAKEFIKCVEDLRRAMHFLVSENSSSEKLVLAQNLMQIAMKRLEKEFYQILSANRQYLDPESVSGRSSRMSGLSQSESSNSNEDDVGLEEEIRMAGESISKVERLLDLAMSDLKSIADCMISSGYGKECIKIYKIIRKSVVDEGLYRLGVERYRSSHINKMNSEVFEHHVEKWLNAVKIGVTTLFNGERYLCDHVFSASDTIRESCFTDIAKEGAINIFKFPELAAKSKRWPAKIFRLMDMYESISDLLPEIELIFSYESISAVRLQALHSLLKLGNSVQTILSEFESSIQKNSSKTQVSSGGIHPLTISAMEYISLLADCSGVLTDIVTNSTSVTQSPLPESYFDIPDSDESPTLAVSIRLAWIILVLLCKLDSKAELYDDTSLSYLFLANNLQFMVEKVRTTNLKYLLGDDWVSKNEKKAKQYAANYEAIAWTKVFSSLPENSTTPMPPEAVKRCFRQFTSAFEEVYQKQTLWLVPDRKLRDEMKVSIAKKLMPAYEEFYDTYLATLSGEKNLEVLVRFAPDNLGNYLSDLFYGTAVSGSSLSSTSSSLHSCVSRCLP